MTKFNIDWSKPLATSKKKSNQGLHEKIIMMLDSSSHRRRSGCLFHPTYLCTLTIILSIFLNFYDTFINLLKTDINIYIYKNAGLVFFLQRCHLYIPHETPKKACYCLNTHRMRLINRQFTYIYVLPCVVKIEPF